MKRRVIWISILVAVLLVGVYYAVSQSNPLVIQVGMREQEIESLLGGKGNRFKNRGTWSTEDGEFLIIWV